MPFKPNKLDGMYLESNEEHFKKEGLKIRPTIPEIYDFKVDTLKSLILPPFRPKCRLVD